MDKNSFQKELEKQLKIAEVEEMAKRATERSTKNIKGSMSDKEFRSSENLLEPGEDPGEGYEGTPDMYPDYEEDKKDKKLRRTPPKLFKGGSILVKTKLGRTKPTKIY